MKSNNVPKSHRVKTVSTKRLLTERLDEKSLCNGSEEVNATVCVCVRVFAVVACAIYRGAADALMRLQNGYKTFDARSSLSQVEQCRRFRRFAQRE